MTPSIESRTRWNNSPKRSTKCTAASKHHRRTEAENVRYPFRPHRPGVGASARRQRRRQGRSIRACLGLRHVEAHLHCRSGRRWRRRTDDRRRLYWGA
uniref:Uncharacterized protein n=1 Tax=uncultured marine virus TaxID=186617 RepID=A0A0F7LB75_9VIRU|nr:hypothetical protein [uncultured marine virus]